jgi:hypothetical protein
LIHDAWRAVVGALTASHSDNSLTPIPDNREK